MGQLGAILGPSWAFLGPPWSNLGPSWGHLGPSWGHLGPSWAFLGPSWSHLEAILGLPGAILGPSWAFLGPPGAILGHLGSILGPSWRDRSQPSMHFFFQLASRESFRNCLLTILSRIFGLILRIFSYRPLTSRWSPPILAIFTRSRAILGLSWAFWSLPMSFRPHKNNVFC